MKVLFVIALITGFSFGNREALAGDYDFDVPEIGLADWQVAGDGKTPTFLQYLDLKGFQAKESKHLLSSTSKGDVVYSFQLELPPALLKPSLTLAYSSESGMNVEMPYGWELKGLVEIRRPLVRAYDTGGGDLFEREWLISGPGFSGTLRPSGDEDYWFYLKSSDPSHVKAKYDTATNSWEVTADGVKWELKEQDNGAGTTAGTALWRSTETADPSGNYVTYSFYTDGRINAVCYGGNQTTGETHLVDVIFDYDENTAERTNARAGFLTTYRYHVTKIRIASHEADTCEGIKSVPGGGFTGGKKDFDIGIKKDIGIKGDFAASGALTGTKKNSPISVKDAQQSAANGKNPGLKTNPTAVSKDIVSTKNTKQTDTAIQVSENVKVNAKGTPVKTVNASASKATGVGTVSASTGVKGTVPWISDSSGKDASTGIVLTGEAQFESMGLLTCLDGWYGYDLEFTVKDSLDLFTKLKRVGGGSAILGNCLSETIAEFEYSEFDDSDTAARTGTAPSSLGAGKSFSRGDDHESTASTTVLLADISGDGLPDVIDASDWNDTEEIWDISHQKVNHTARTFSWENQTISSGELESYPGVVVTEPAVDASTATRSLTERQLVDLDGDGFLDFLISTGTTSWRVYWGNSDHRLDDSTSLVPPPDWDAAQVSWAVKADHYNAANFTKDVAIGLIDFNGDGFLDCYDPAGGKVWLHDGTKEDGAGWSKSLNLSHQFEALRSVEYTIGSESYEPDISDFCADEAQDACEEAADEALDACTQACEDDEEFACTEQCEEACEDSCSGASDEDECRDECEDENDCDFPDECIDNCIEGCEDDAWDETYDDCESEFIDECEDGAERTRSKYISATDEIGAFLDMNGDGLPDYVDSSATPWQVYLNNGTDLEDPVDWASPKKYSSRVDEGRPEIDYESSDYDIDDHESGSPSRVYQMVLDVDGDGLPDLALGESLGKKWHKNTGSGFETSSRDLPGWWPDDFVISEASTEVNADDGESDGENSTTNMMIDLDHDGAVDYVYRNGASTGVKYGPYPKPNLITKIKNGQYGETTASYRSLATVTPSGDWSKEQKTSNVKSLADVIFSIDGLTGQNSETSFAYQDGEFVDGIFRGFKDRDVTRKINSAWSSETKYDYELNRDFEPLVTVEKLYVDGNLSFGSVIKKSSSTSSKLRYRIDNTYADYVAGKTDYRLLTNRKVIEYGESTGSKSYNVEFTWDNYGNMTQYLHKGGAGTDDQITITMSYFPNTDDHDTADFYRMTQKTVNGTDPLSGAVRDFQIEKYYYDGNAAPDEPMTAGLLTKTEASAGWIDGGEGLQDKKFSIEYARGTRGETISVLDVETGNKMDQAYGFGSAILQTQTNGLGHKLTRVIDSRGRVTSVQDDNGMKVGFSYDAFNRVTKKTVTGSDSKTYTLKVQSYERNLPYYDVTKWYAEDGSVEETDYAIQDGFGNVVQTWNQDETGNYLATTRINDLRGLLLKSSHPVDKGNSFVVPMTSFLVTNPMGVSYYDALGEAREVIRDSAVSSGSQLAYHDNPRETVSQDEEGYQTRTTYDVHKRVTKVEQGKGGSYVTTAEYRYDPLNRLVRFQDGGGVYYAYSYDGVGRLRQVKHGAPSGAATDWYSYEYKGTLKTKMTDPTGAYAAWEHDVLGRVIKQTMTDSLPSSPGDLVYEYEYDSTWKGVLSKITDPAGTTEFEYDSLGREAKAKRTYSASLTMPGGAGAEISYVRDIRNRVASKTLPSGKSLSLTYSHGHLSKLVSNSATGSKEYDLTFDYNDWDLLSLVCSSKGHEFSREFTTPLRPDQLEVLHGTKAYQRDYEWFKNGLLSEVTHRTDEDEASSCPSFQKFPGGAIQIPKIGNDGVFIGKGKTVSTQDGKTGSGQIDKTGTAGVTSKTGTITKQTATSQPAKKIAGTTSKVAAPTSAKMPSSTVSATAKSASPATAGSLAAKPSTGGIIAGSVSGSKTSSVVVGSASAILFSTTYNYSYDSIKQLTLLTSNSPLGATGLGLGGLFGSTKTIESYAYDAAGSLTSMKDNAGATWTYGTPGTLNQILSRTSSKGGSDTYAYDAAGRMTKWTSSAGTYEYYYDGLGRLRGVTLGGIWQTVYDYDDANGLLRIGDNNPFTSSPYYVYNFRDWRFDEKTGAVTEEENAFVSAVNGTRSWKFHEYDGHVAITMDDAGVKTSSRTSGGYGNVISDSGTPWALNAYHGTEDQGELFHMGQRHLMQEDGLWLQPEPLLYMGIPADQLATPRSLATYRYASNSPTSQFDAAGFHPADFDADYKDPNEDHISVDVGDEQHVTVEELQDYDDKEFAQAKIVDFTENATNNPANEGCVSNSVARDYTYNGRHTTGTPEAFSTGSPVASPIVIMTDTRAIMVDGTAKTTVEGLYGETFKAAGKGYEGVQAGSYEGAVKSLQEAGPGATAIVFIARPDGTSHMFNMVNNYGEVLQAGRGSVNQGDYFMVMVTND